MTNLKKTIALLTIAGFALTMAACSDNHDHGPTPEGLNLLIDGEVVASQVGTTITYPGELNHIALTAGETSGTVQVQWIMSDGETHNFSTEDGYSLSYEVSDDSILSVNHPVNNSEWNIELVGESAGAANFMLQLFHVGHSDFDSRMFQVVVIEG